MNDRIRLFAQFLCLVLAFGLMVLEARLGRASHPTATPEVAASARVTDCTGTAGFWGWSVDPVTGRRTLECQRYA